MANGIDSCEEVPKWGDARVIKELNWSSPFKNFSYRKIFRSIINV